MKIILGSTSLYKKKLFSRLSIPFSQMAPTINESDYPQVTDEAPKDFALRLSKIKAESLRDQNSNHLIIGADQVLEFESQVYGKPLSRRKNIEDLLLFSGKSHFLHTAVTLISPQAAHSFVDTTQLTMHSLTDYQIKQYVDKEQAFDCAGGYKIESFGISLFKEIKTDDFTAIEGLPLIKLNSYLKELGSCPT